MNVIWRRSNISYSLFRVITHETRKNLLLNCVHYNTALSCTKLPSLKPTNTFYSVIRQKSKRNAYPDSDDENEVFDDDLSLSRDSKVMKINTTSLRTDAILKSVLGVARNKIEKLFYESKIRVNGKKILKKSMAVQVDYEIDVIKSVSPKNPDHLYVSRVEILNIAAKEESIVITARRFKTLLIENYENDPYKASSSEEDK